MTISPLLVKASPEREICNVTPESAGWQHVGFRALRLRAGDTETLDTGARELCVVVLTGTVRAEVDGHMYDALGKRDSVFDDVSPDALYVPGGKTVTLVATRDAEVALCTAPYVSGDKQVQRLDGERMRRAVRGQGTNTRYVCDILMGDNPAADRLLVVEVVTPASHSSSYPPHKHDRDAAPDETSLEETYYHRIDPPQGFAFQRVHRRSQPRRGLRGGEPRRGDGAARLSPGGRAARLQPVLPERDGRPEPRMGVQERSRARVDARCGAEALTCGNVRAVNGTWAVRPVTMGRPVCA